MPLGHQLALWFICLIWAGNFLASAWAVKTLPPITATVLRFALVLLLLLRWLRPPERSQWPWLVAACWCVGAAHFGLLFIALGRSQDISSIALLMQVYVPISTLLAALLLGERIGWRTASGIALAFSGVLVVGLDPLVLAQLDVLGLVLCSAFFLALGTILMRRVQGVGVFQFQAWNAALALLPLGALALWREQPQAIAWTRTIHGPALLAVVYSAIGASIIGHGTFYWLLQRHPVGLITPTLMLVPLLAVGLGVLVHGDRPGTRVLIGGAMIIAGVLWVTLRARKRRRAVPVVE
ncbi:MAG: DMT family transporter [Wenzhouxiangellaceae bacterium]